MGRKWERNFLMRGAFQGTERIASWARGAFRTREAFDDPTSRCERTVPRSERAGVRKIS